MSVRSSSSNSRPRSKTKSEKDLENKIKAENIRKVSSETEERELITETETDSSSWITESQDTITKHSEEETQTNKSEGSMTDIKSLTGTYTLASESDDSNVVVVPPLKETVAKKREDRTRGNIPNTTISKPYLRSHSGSWRNHRKKKPNKNEKITVSHPVEQPFQPNLRHTVKREQNNNAKESDSKSSVELPKLKDDQINRSNSSSENPPDVLIPGLQSTAKTTSTTRISRSIENVISKLDRRSISVLPQIGKTSPDGKRISRTMTYNSENLFQFWTKSVRCRW